MEVGVISMKTTMTKYFKCTRAKQIITKASLNLSPTKEHKNRRQDHEVCH